MERKGEIGWSPRKNGKYIKFLFASLLGFWLYGRRFTDKSSKTCQKYGLFPAVPKCKLIQIEWVLKTFGALAFSPQEEILLNYALCQNHICLRTQRFLLPKKNSITSFMQRSCKEEGQKCFLHPFCYLDRLKDISLI